MIRELKATYAGDSEYYHLFDIDGGQELVGTIHVPKGKPVPRTIMIRLRTQEEAEAEAKRKPS
jgi:hypothetical protein